MRSAGACPSLLLDHTLAHTTQPTHPPATPPLHAAASSTSGGALAVVTACIAYRSAQVVGGADYSWADVTAAKPLSAVSFWAATPLIIFGFQARGTAAPWLVAAVRWSAQIRLNIVLLLCNYCRSATPTSSLCSRSFSSWLTRMMNRLRARRGAPTGAGCGGPSSFAPWWQSSVSRSASPQCSTPSSPWLGTLPSRPASNQTSFLTLTTATTSCW